MTDNKPVAACSAKEWMVPPVLIPIVFVLGIAIWVATRSHFGL